MLCRLCIEECIDYQTLIDDTGNSNDIYKICAKYFQAELAKFETDDLPAKDIKAICGICWQTINEFNTFVIKIKDAQEKFNELLPFEEVIKLEQLEPEVQFYDASTPNNLEELAKPEFEDEPAIDALVIADTANASLINFKVENDENVSESFASEMGNDTGSEYGDNSDDEEDADDDKPLAEIMTIKRKRAAKSCAVSSTKQRAKHRGRPKKSNSSSSSDQKTDEQRKATKNLQKTKTAEHDKFIADWKQILPCELCSFGAETFAKLRAHFRAEHASKKPYVTCCDKKYNNRFHLVEHIRVHLNPETFKCPECGKCSANSRSLATHIKSVHGAEQQEKKYQCEICEKRFAKKAVLQGHMDIHAEGQKDHVCPHCGKGFVLAHKLKVHIRNIHCASCVCEQCGRSFRNTYSLKDHLLEHKGITKPKWPCDQCPAQLNSKYSLMRHKRIAHHDGSTLYVCSECGKVALNEGALLSHKKNVHERPRKFKCTICDKAFKVAQVLREHMTIHTGEELYNCPHCPKTFRVSANMHHHRKRVHPKEWAEKRSQRPYIPNTDMSQVSHKVVL